MAYEFFLSYTRANNEKYLQQFFEDLSVEIRVLQGLPKSAVVGFFDQREIELGEDWDTTIVDALNSSKVVLAAASAAYFKSEYCGKELSLFAQRLPARTAAGAFPPVIKPIVWAPFNIDEAPGVFKSRQVTFGDPQALHNTKGFRHLMKQMNDHQTVYNDLVLKLAQDIIAAGKANPLPRLGAPSSLREVPSWWGPAAGVTTVPPLEGATADPNRVHFIYVAADPRKFGGARSRDAYLDYGGADWKPFFPDKTRIHRFMQQVLAADDLDFTSDEVSFGPNLLQQIDAAKVQRQIVVLVVDAWSLHWDHSASAQEYHTLLRELDSQNDFHWSVLVPWNDQDLELVSARDTIEQLLASTFPFHGRLSRNPMFFRDGIKSFDELKRALTEVLTRLKDEIRKQAPVSMPLPAGPSKSVVSGSAA